MRTLLESIDLGAARAERAHRPQGVKVMLRDIVVETAVYTAMAVAVIVACATIF